MGEGGKRKSRHEAPPAPPSHRILSSDELGLLKVTEVPSGSKWEETAAKQRWGQPDKQQGVTRLAVHCPGWNFDRCLIAAGRAGGRVTLHSAAHGGELGSFRAAPPAATSGRTDTSTHAVQALRFAPAAAAAGDGGEGQESVLLVSATVGGHVALHRSRLDWAAVASSSAAAPGGGGGGEGEEDDDPVASAAATAARGSVVASWEEVHRMQTVGNLQAMDVSSSGRHVAVGGDGHQLKVWDLSAAASSSGDGDGGGGAATAAAAAPEPLFAGKAGKPSRSGLQDLAHVSALCFVPGSDDKQVLVGTGKHKLWLYDMRAGRKPQAELVWSEGRVTALAPQPDGQRVWVGNGRGQIEALDLRQAPGKISMGHALKGSAGSIRSLSLHPSEPLIASVSLDRHLRLHSTHSRALLARVYLKQALTGVAWLPPPPPPADAAGAGAGADSDDGDDAEGDADYDGGADGANGAAGAAAGAGGRRGKSRSGSKSRDGKDGRPRKEGSQSKSRDKGREKDKGKKRRKSGE